MKSDATMLSEVVVYTGYMTQKKADLTGSVAMANASDLKKNASANAMKSLQGKMAGVHTVSYTHLDVYKRQLYNGEFVWNQIK